MPSADALSQTLTSITATKLSELSKQRAAFEAKKTAILDSANRQPNQHARISALLEGLRKLANDQVEEPNLDSDEDDSDSDDDSITGLDDSLKNIKGFLLQSKHDPSVPTTLLTEWEEQLKQELEKQSIKHRHAYFFGQLVTEWLENPNNVMGPENNADSSEEDVAISVDSFEEVGRKEMHEQRTEWESLVFQASETDPQAIEKYLNELFGASKSARLGLKDLRRSVTRFAAHLKTKTGQFDAAVLDWCSKSLLKSDSLTDEKRRILMEIQSNKSVVSEVADVLNMRMAALEDWSWPASGVPVEARRQLNGKYRIYMDEDLLDALLLHFVGMKWAVQFKTVFTAFFNSSAWKKSSRAILKRDRDRREYYLGDDGLKDHESLHTLRQRTYNADYFMAQLPRTLTEGAKAYDSDGDSDAGVTKGPIEIKQSLLHLLSTESLLATSLYGHFTVIRSDFKWFGPSLPFNSIFTVLKFFGVPEGWIKFFAKFLQAPMKFVHDGPQAHIQTRKRGVPIDHVLSDVLGEAMLFCMDFAVNQGSDGSILYRLHDDFWFWGQEETCGNAWLAMTKFAEVMGISFNEEKTGTVRLTRVGETPVARGNLPKGDVRWGFLKLDAATGRFLIDQDQVDEHVAELQRQLEACKSVFAWVQAWNSYLARFFVTNFGKPANCFGRRHVDMMIETFGRIQRKLFADMGVAGVTSVTEYLRRIIQERFQVNDLPDGFFYFPVEMGGLELRNPFISLFAMRETIHKNPWKKLEKAFDKDEEAYTRLKEAFEKGTRGGKSFIFDKGTFNDEEDKRTFMSLQEYNKYREETSIPLLAAYNEFLGAPIEKEVQETPEVTAALAKADVKGGPWETRNAYDMWVVQLYAAEMINRFGGLRTVDKGAVPLGVVNMLRSGKVKWQG